MLEVVEHGVHVADLTGSLQVPRRAEVPERAPGLRVHDDEVVLVATGLEAVGGPLLVRAGTQAGGKE